VKAFIVLLSQLVIRKNFALVVVDIRTFVLPDGGVFTLAHDCSPRISHSEHYKGNICKEVFRE
jgi:hypothetical protein